MNFWEHRNFVDEVTDLANNPEKGGFTFDPFDKVFVDLAGKKLDIVTLASKNFPRKQISEHAIGQFLALYVKMFERRILADVCVGAYYFAGSDEISIDINVKVHRAHRAATMEFAMRNNQYSIWDCLRSSEVIIGGSGKTVLTDPEDVRQAAEALTDVREYVFPAVAKPVLKWRKDLEKDLPYQYVDAATGTVHGECDHCFGGSSFGDNWWRCGEQSGRFPSIRQCRNHIEELVSKQ